jgi:hypothetical protein
VDLDVNSIAAGLVVSSVGFIIFRYGRKMSRPPHVLFGLVLMVFPYVVPNVLVMFGIAGLLCALLWLATQRGY